MSHRTLQLKPSRLKFILLFRFARTITLFRPYYISLRNRFRFLQSRKICTIKKNEPTIIETKFPFHSVSIQITRPTLFVPKTILNKFPPLHGVETRGINEVLSIVTLPPAISILKLVREYASHASRRYCFSRNTLDTRPPINHHGERRQWRRRKGLLVDIRSDQNIHFSRFNTACIRGRDLWRERGGET